MTSETSHLLALTTEIVVAYAASTPLAAAELPGLIATVHAALRSAGQTDPEPSWPLVPAVPINRSVGAHYLICLEDGRKMKMLRRYLATRHGLTPEAYRQRWGLPSDYPMVAPAYAAQRSAIAIAIGLGGRPTGRAGGRRRPEA
jgi:predicted transcriptional regulator